VSFVASPKTAPPGAVFIAVAGYITWSRSLLLLSAVVAMTAFPSGAHASITLEASPVANLTYQLDCVSDVVPACGAREAFRDLWRTTYGADARDDPRVARWRDLRAKYQGSISAAPGVRPWFELMQRVRHAGLQARSPDEYERYVALLTTTAHAHDLASVLRELWSPFDAWWRGAPQSSLSVHVSALAEALAMPDMRAEIAAIEAFYGVARGAAPFVVHAIHRPIASGITTTAQVIGDVAVAEIPADDTLERRLPVIVHEYAHLLLSRVDEQKLAELRAAVVKAGGSGGRGAWMEFDEAIATALGNGRVYRRLASNDEWTRYVRSEFSFYTRDETDRAAKAVLPLVDTFIRDGRSIASPGFAAEYAAVVKRALGDRLIAPIALLSEFAMVSDAALGEKVRSVVQEAVQAKTGTYSFWAFSGACCGPAFLKPLGDYPDKPQLVVIPPQRLAASTFLPASLRTSLARQRSPAFAMTTRAGASPMIVIVARSADDVATTMRSIFARRSLDDGGAYSATSR